MELAVALAPAMVMLLGSAAVFFLAIPSTVQAATQMFSAGILIAAVAGELFPLLAASRAGREQDGLDAISAAEHCLFVGCGFAAALVFMFSIATLSEDAGELAQPVAENKVAEFTGAEDPDQEMASGTLDSFLAEASGLALQLGQLQANISSGSRDDVSRTLHSLMYTVDKAKRCLTPVEPLESSDIARLQGQTRQLQEQGASLKLQSSPGSAHKAMRSFELSLGQLCEQLQHGGRFRRWRTLEPPAGDAEVQESIAWALVSAVAVDAAVDGLLVGLSLAASETTGLIIAIATCIEMGFLGWPRR